MFELVDNAPQNAVIKVIGVGGGGGNAVRHMIEHDIEGVDFICANTDSQALADIDSKTVLQLGNSITKGLGCLLYTSPSPRDRQKSRMPSSA